MFNKRLRMKIKLLEMELGRTKEMEETWTNLASNRQVELDTAKDRLGVAKAELTVTQETLMKAKEERTKFKKLVREQSAADMLVISMMAIGLIPEPQDHRPETTDERTKFYQNTFNQVQANYQQAAMQQNMAIPLGSLMGAGFQGLGAQGFGLYGGR